MPERKSFSNCVRRAVYTHTLAPARIAERIDVPAAQFVDFLAGDRALLSDAIDRLCKLLRLTVDTPTPWPIEKPQFRRIYTTHTPAQVRRLRKVRKLIAAELPDLIRRNQLAREAAKEPTVCGALRRAIHSCRILLPDLARRSDLEMQLIGDFLSGETTLPSDALDRLVAVLKLKVAHAISRHKPREAKTS